MKTAVLYIRVSTDDQAQGYSLDHQEESLRNYCSQNNIKILALYREDYSAKTFNRPEIKKMLASFKKSENRPTYMLFTKWDRFSRNIGHAYEMIETLESLNIEPQAIEQKLDMAVPESQLILAVYLATPAAENLRRALNVMVGMRKAKKEGRFMGMAPPGYKNTFDNVKKVKTIAPDFEAPIMIWTFNEILKGETDTATLYSIAKGKGLKVSKSGYYRALRSPVYCGKIVVEAYKDEQEIIVNGIHEPLISELEFERVQMILDGKLKKVPGYKATAKPELPLRGFLGCPRCGSQLTGSASKGGSGIRHYYYHCSKGCKERVRADFVNEAFRQKLTEFTFQDEISTLHSKIVSNLFGSKNVDKQKLKAKNEALINKQEEKIKHMRDLLSSGQISAQDFNDFKSEVMPKIAELKLEVTDEDDSEVDFKKYLKSGISLIKHIDSTYDSAPLEEKQKLIRSIFPEKMIFSENTLRTPKLNTVIPLICTNTKGNRGNKKKTEGQIDPLSHQVAATGIEPVSTR